jgi:FkbM family methyltransferase
MDRLECSRGIPPNRYLESNRAIMLASMGTIRSPRLPRSLATFLHKGLGLKNLTDHIEQRQSLLGLINLPIRTVLDVGANKGSSARDFLRMFPEAHVYCIEPIPRLCKEIERWSRSSGKAVTVANLALARKPGKSTFYVDKRNDIWSTFIEPSVEHAARYDPITVHVDTLDHVVEGMDLVDNVLVKIDTEGWDLEVILGGSATLSRATAVIIESVFYPNPLGAGAPTFEDISRALWELGYVYRGNVRVGCHHGTPMLADVLFVQREAAKRMVERA